MGFECCRNCVPQKRNPYCHCSCPEYITAKAAHDRRREEYYRDDKINGAINLERGKKVCKALKDRVRR